MPKKLLIIIVGLLAVGPGPAGSGAEVQTDWPGKPLFILTSAQPFLRWPALDNPDPIIVEALMSKMRFSLGVPVNFLHQTGGSGGRTASALASAHPMVLPSACRRWKRP